MSNYDALVTKLREIFQIDRPELDFGVYRILNARADEINAYLSTRLKERVAEALASGNQASTKQLEHDLELAINSAKDLGADPEATPKVKELRESLKLASSGASEHENAVFTHLLTFFSRYYNKGDFISQRRYKGDTYAIPYAGEEVVLHWANKDQYYTKSGEAFSNYGFKLDDGRTVQFRLIAADTAKDNRKDNDKDRRFVLAEERVVTRIDEEGEEYEDTIVPVAEEGGTLIIRFEYKAMPKGTKQDALVSQAVAAVLSDEVVKAKWLDLTERAPTDSNSQRTILEKCLTNYTQRNTADYFIHKDLGGFLRRELDFYIKNEVMHLDDVQNAESFGAIEKNLRMIQCLRRIAGDLITFLASIEDFQKKLWLKKKFVVAAHYCITLDRVPEELYPTIAANEAQWAQWHDLGMHKSAKPGTVENLKADPYLMVDSALYGEEFRAELLKAIQNLDGVTDGLLVNGDNFQALTLLRDRYQGQVNCIYIDPPYNSDATPIIYKNGFHSSSWLSLMENRLSASLRLLDQNDGYFSIAIDDNEIGNLTELVQTSYSQFDLHKAIVNHYPGSGTGRSNISRTHEYNLFLVPNDADLLRGKAREGGERERGFARSGQGENNFRTGRPNSFYAVLVDPEKVEVVGVEPPPIGSEYPRAQTDDGFERIYPLGGDGSERCWTLSYERAKLEIENQSNVIFCSPNLIIKRRYNDDETRDLLPSMWVDTKFSASANGTNLLTGLFGVAGTFSNPKSIYTVMTAIEAGTFEDKNAVILDYFAGSGTTGHAVVNLNRRDGGGRKYALVEQGAYFDTVIKPRLQKVVYSDTWQNGNPAMPETGMSHAFKVLKIESYEDTLNNLALARDDKQKDLVASMGPSASDDYLMRYMLDVEARGSLLSVEDFKKPFDYELNIAVDSAGAYERRKVDLVETFNYLIGLTVKTVDIQLKQGFVAVEGTLPTGERTLVLWRDCEKLDYDGLAKLCDKLAINPADSEYDVVYLNGDHNIPSVLTSGAEEGEVTKVLKLRQIEPTFLEAMFGMEDA